MKRSPPCRFSSPPSFNSSGFSFPLSPRPVRSFRATSPTPSSRDAARRSRPGFIFSRPSIILLAAQFHTANAAVVFLVLISFTANATHSILGTAAAMDIGGAKMAGFASGVIDSFQYFGGSLAGYFLGRAARSKLGQLFLFHGALWHPRRRADAHDSRARSRWRRPSSHGSNAEAAVTHCVFACWRRSCLPSRSVFLEAMFVLRWRESNESSSLAEMPATSPAKTRALPGAMLVPRPQSNVNCSLGRRNAAVESARPFADAGAFAARVKSARICSAKMPSPRMRDLKRGSFSRSPPRR